MKNDKIKFLNFLESIKTAENAVLVESVIKGFTILIESTGTPIIKDLIGRYNGVMVDISVNVTDVETEGYPAEHGGMDSPSWDAGHDLAAYKASARLTPLSQDYEPNGESPVDLPETEFSKIKIIHLPHSNNNFNYYANPDGSTTLDNIVDMYIEANIHKWAPDRNDGRDHDRDDY